MSKLNGVVLFVLMMMALFGSNVAHAWSNPDQSGVCYFFSNNNLKSKTPCVISSGGGAGGMYIGLTVNGKTYGFETSTMTEDGETTYNGKPVHTYLRHIGFYTVLTDEEAENYENVLYCYRTRDRKLDVCHN